MKKVGLICAAILVVSCQGSGQSPTADSAPPSSGPAKEKLVISTFNPSDFGAILDGSYQTEQATINGTLYFPKEQMEKYPAVVIVPGSGGVKGWMRDIVGKRLNDAGIAALVIDSFGGRKVRQTTTDQSRVTVAASVTDGFAAFQTLAQHPKIDTDRIGITGFSRGGITALFTAEARLQKAVLADGKTFAAHGPVYPSCNTQFDNPATVSTPIFMMLGEKDEVTPAEKCVEYAGRLKQAGANVTTKVYDGAHHGWINYQSTAKYSGNGWSYGKCDFRINDKGTTRHDASGATDKSGWSAFVKAVTKSCGKRGFTYGGNSRAANEALADMVAYFSAM